MGFELCVKGNTPLIGEDDKDQIARMFLEHIGYITKGSDPSVPLSLFMECFMSQPEKPWLAEEMTVKLNISIPTVYRHLNKLKALDILEEVKLEDEIKTKEGKKMIQVKKGYKLRYSNLSKAWTFVEAHVEAAMESYRKTVDHLQKTVDKDKHAKEKGSK